MSIAKIKIFLLLSSLAALSQCTNVVAQEKPLKIKASDGDEYDISINTSDQALFQNAAGYVFDAAVYPLAGFRTNNDTLYVYKSGGGVSFKIYLGTSPTNGQTLISNADKVLTFQAGGIIGDTVMIQIPAALFDTTKSGGPDWKESGLFRSFYWEFNGSVAETLIVRDDAAVDLPGYFSSFVRVEGQWEAEQTGTDSLRVHAQGFSHDAAHTVSSLSLTNKNFAILSSGTGPAANDWRSDAKDPTVTGTFSANQHLHMLVTRGSADTGIMRFYGIKLYFLRVK